MGGLTYVGILIGGYSKQPEDSWYVPRMTTSDGMMNKQIKHKLIQFLFLFFVLYHLIPSGNY